jgi:hypothetical protein
LREHRGREVIIMTKAGTEKAPQIKIKIRKLDKLETTGGPCSTGT